MNTTEPLEICTGSSPNASIIWMHGLGADGYDFAPVVRELQPLPHIRFILPHAPSRAVTLNGGYVMPAWYDVYGKDLGDKQDETGIRASQAFIEALIARERKRGIASHRIALAGFSQGGAIALHTGLRHGEKLAGIMALSTYLPLHQQSIVERTTANGETPIFIAHGTFDDIIPLGTGQKTSRFLAENGYPIEWHEYPMPHSVSEREIADIRNFICRILPAT